MDIKQLKPALVWKYFHEICQIPHVSYNEKGITNYIMHVLKAAGLNPQVDETSNIFVTKAAKKGLEKLPIVLLQAHSDMVGTKADNSLHNFDKDSIKTIVQDGWVYADKTTLGADDGIGVACILAILTDPTIQHGQIEALFTSREEVGMEGIKKFDIKKIKGKYLINLDGENNLNIEIGCPGSVYVRAAVPFKRENKIKSGTQSLRITIKGLLSGHSGQMIDQKRINAIKEIFDILMLISLKHEIRIINIERSGTAKNVIPSACSADICIKEEDLISVQKIIESEKNNLQLEYWEETGIELFSKKISTKTLPITLVDSKRIIAAYSSVFNGMYTRNKKFDMPETSSSLGLIETTTNSIKSWFMVRSPYDNAQTKLANRIIQTFVISGGTAQTEDFTPGWLPLQDNILTKTYYSTCKRVCKKEPIICISAGGVEPSFILPKVQGMAGIAVGPTVENVHSIEERLNIESVDKFYKVLSTVLKEVR